MIPSLFMSQTDLMQPPMLRSAFSLLPLVLALNATAVAATNDQAGDDLFTGPVRRIRIEIPTDGMAILRNYQQVWRQPRPERIDARATVREAGRVFTNVAVHLKGSWTFRPIDDRPSLTLNFDKFADGQKFHGLTKVHVNNSIQDPAGLHEQFARELFRDLGVPAPRATPVLVTLNGRDLGLCVLVEGANKQFVKRNFGSARGNLYDGGSGGDVSKALEVDSGEHPEDRSDLTNLVAAARERDPARRLARLTQLLDVDRFITLAAVEAYIVHWDGYAIGCNNYRVVNDASRGKLVFMPHGLDQIFGISASIEMKLEPVFKGLVAKALFAVPEARERYRQRIESLSTNELRPVALHARVDRLAARIRQALPKNQAAEVAFAAQNLKDRITRRAASVMRQLGERPRPVAIPADGLRLTGWTFRAGTTRSASGSRVISPDGTLLRVTANGQASSGAWRTTVFLDQGRYDFTGRARTRGVAAVPGATNGVLLRISGERATSGIAITEDWKPFSYTFEVRGLEDVELVCELRAPEGQAEFAADSLRLLRHGPPQKPPATVQ